MDIPGPPPAVAAFAAFVRERLAEVSGALSPLWPRPGDTGRRPAVRALPGERSSAGPGRPPVLAVVGAAAPFASTSYSRARLLRQLHASGLLSAEVAQPEALGAGPGPETLGRDAGAADASGAPR